MAQAKGDRQAERESVEDNFDEMLKVFEGDTVLQGQICESSTSVSFFIDIYYSYYIYYSNLEKRIAIATIYLQLAIQQAHLDAIPTFIATKLIS